MATYPPADVTVERIGDLLQYDCLPCSRQARYQTYTHEHDEDMPEVRDWIWTDM